jgi:TonB-linked SusC/RagA family outer membrane protein
MMSFCLTAVFAQTTVKGTVLDKFGEAVIGANVMEKGTTNGVITDIDGKFTLQVASNNSVLQISFIGYTPQEITVGDRTSLSITLKEADLALEEVVVVGYGVQKKRDLTGAVSSVKLSDAPVATFSTVSHALAGKAAGLRVIQNSAQVGGGSTFTIRGATSINAGNSPLFIIDGFPVSSSASLGSGNRYDAGSTDNILESINPNDIESIEVLKDASATAIYGSRAGHGVIIITTKRGKQGEKLKVSYSGNASVQTISNGYDMLNGAEYRQQVNRVLYERWLRNNGQGIYAGYITPKDNPEPFVPKYSEADIANAPNVDWLGAVTRTGVQHSHNVSLTGGSDRSQYLASVNYFTQEGIVKNNKLDRLSVAVNDDYKISEFVKTGISLNLNRNQYDNVPLGTSGNEYAGIIASAVRFDPAQPVRDANGEYSIFPAMAQWPNPVSLLEITDHTTKDRLLLSGYIQAEPVKGLILKVNAGFDRKYAKRANYLPHTTKYGAAEGGSANISADDDLDRLLDLTASYNTTINDHSLTALVGYSYQDFYNEGFSAGNYDFAIDGFTYNNLDFGNGIKPSVSSWASKSALGSYFGRLNYSFKGKYLLTATIRADGASNFSPEHRWGYFPSASLGWRFSDEDFLGATKDFLSNGKLRIGYGETGNSNVGNRTIDYFGPGGSWVFGNTPSTGVKASQLGNKELTWETTSEFNAGLDVGFFDNRINLTVEYYNRVISDLLVTGKSLMSYNEITTIAANIGKTQGQGFELTLNTYNIQNRDFKWTTDATFSTYRDRWLERDPDWKPNAYESETDYIRSIFRYYSDGLLQVGEAAPAWQKSLMPGQIKMKDVSGPDGTPDGVLDQYDRYLLGSEDPAFSFGFNNTFKYRRFDLNFYFYGEVGRWRGRSYYNDWTFYFNTDEINMSRQNINAWSHDNLSSSIPSILKSDYATSHTDDYFYKKISFARCRNITLGYTFTLPKNLISNIRAYLNIGNPFVLTNWDGIDPETDNGAYSYPNVRTYSLGLDISF